MEYNALTGLYIHLPTAERRYKFQHLSNMKPDWRAHLATLSSPIQHQNAFCNQLSITIEKAARERNHDQVIRVSSLINTASIECSDLYLHPRGYIYVQALVRPSGISTVRFAPLPVVSGSTITNPHEWSGKKPPSKLPSCHLYSSTPAVSVTKESKFYKTSR